MLRRELIMLEPYRQRRFRGHRQRVASASPAVEVGPPRRPVHVADTKRHLSHQREKQWRHLEQDVRLMRALADIMNSKRVDDRNTEFFQYRRMLRGSRTHCVDRSPPPPPSPDPIPTRDAQGKPLRLCQREALRRQRAHSSPATAPLPASPLDQWPDAWLLQYRQRRAPKGQQERREPLTPSHAGADTSENAATDLATQNERQPKRSRGKSRTRKRRQPVREHSTTSTEASLVVSPRKTALVKPKQRSLSSESSSSTVLAKSSDENPPDQRSPLASSLEKHSADARIMLSRDPEVKRRLRDLGMVMLPEKPRCRCTALHQTSPIQSRSGTESARADSSSSFFSD